MVGNLLQIILMLLSPKDGIEPQYIKNENQFKTVLQGGSIERTGMMQKKLNILMILNKKTLF